MRRETRSPRRTLGRAARRPDDPTQLRRRSRVGYAAPGTTGLRDQRRNPRAGLEALQARRDSGHERILAEEDLLRAALGGPGLLDVAPAARRARVARLVWRQLNELAGELGRRVDADAAARQERR